MRKIFGKRIHIIDTLRGILILNMIAYHTSWDLKFIFGLNMPWFDGVCAFIWQQCICCGFILISGISWRINTKTERKIKNGLVLLACGALITAVTLQMQPADHIIFGILTFMGSAVLIMIPLDRLFKRVNAYVGFFASLLLFVLLREINEGSVFFGTAVLPTGLYKGLFMTYLGFMEKGFYSADYFSLLPWLPLYWCGYFLSPVVTGADERVLGTGIEPAAVLGRNSLVLYLLHQPVVYGVLTLFFKVTNN